MGVTPRDKIDRWMKSAGQFGKSKEVERRVVTAGEFLEKTARMNEHQASTCLTGIDFSKPVEVTRLPPSIFIQYVEQHNGDWFTDTGLTADLIGLAEGKRQRKMFQPIGVVHAIKSTARSIKDYWTADRLFQSIAPQARPKIKMGQQTRGGGTQYIVFDKTRMKEI